MERKTATAQVRLSPSIKNEAEGILHAIGLSPSSAIEMFYRQVIVFKGLPFSPKLPNAKTLEAMKEVEEKKGRSFKTVDALFEDLEA